MTDHNKTSENSSQRITQNNFGMSTMPNEMNTKENEEHSRAAKTRKK